MPRKDQDENTSAPFVRMDPEQRRQFEEGGPLKHEDDRVTEVEFDADDPRDEDRMGRHAQPESEELREEKAAEVDESGPPRER